MDQVQNSVLDEVQRDLSGGWKKDEELQRILQNSHDKPGSMWRKLHDILQASRLLGFPA